MRAHQFILREYSREITAQKMGTALLQKFRKEPPQWQQRIVGDQFTDDPTVLQYLLGRIELADPTKNKQYVPWLIRAYTTAPSLKFEDLITKFTDPLQKFFKLVSKKQIPAPNNDIGRIKDLATLVQLVDQYPDVVDQPKDVDRGQAKPYYEDADIRVIVPEDVTAACYYGQGTKWCTAARENNMFDRYNKQGEMYIILPKKPTHPGEKYQLHFQSKQFMNEKDQRVPLVELRERFPQLADIFEKQAKEFNILGLRKDIDDVYAATQRALPVFRSTLKSLIAREAKAKAREIFVELGRAVRVLKGMEEIWELAEDMFDDKAGDLVRVATSLVADEPESVNDEDFMYDELSERIIEVTHSSELWYYIQELLEELENQEAEFDASMTINGEVISMMQKLIPEALAEAIEITK